MEKTVKLHKDTRLPIIIKLTIVLIGLLICKESIVNGQINTPYDQIVVLIVFALVVIPIFIRNGIIINKIENTLVLKKSIFSIILRKKTFNVRDTKSILIYSESESSGTKTLYFIKLIGKKNSLLVRRKDLFSAIKIAKKIAEILNIPYQNKVYNSTSTLAPNNLWIPICKQWLNDKITYQKPTKPETLKAKITEKADSFSIQYSIGNPIIKPILYTLIVISVIAITTLIYFNIHNGLAYLNLAFVLFICVFVLLFTGKHQIKISKNGLYQKVGILKWKKNLKFKNINEYIVLKESLIFIGTKSIVAISLTQDNDLKEYLKEMIPYQIQKLSS